jgi:RNA polymerase sigma-70 factor (ECF subfamily)
VSVEVRLVRPPSAQAEELEWIARTRAGDAAACEALHRRYHGALWRFAYAQVRSAEAAEEIVDDVFLSLWHDPSEWEPATSARAWLFGAVRHQALRHLRQERDTARFTVRRPLDAAPTSADAGAEEPTIASVLAAVPERRRVAMTLRWCHGMRAPEIGHVLGTTPEVARVLLSRARQELAGLLQRVHG